MRITHFLTIIKTNAMNYFSKNKVIVWVLIFLVILLFTALISLILFYSGKSANVNQSLSGNTEKRFQRELLLSPDQEDKVEAILKEYRNATEPLSTKIRNNRVQLLDELANSNPDSNLINNYLEAISNLQKQMQRASVKQYMSLKEICTPIQCQKLSSLYFELYGCQGQGKGMGKGKGMMHRYRRGQGN